MKLLRKLWPLRLMPQNWAVHYTYTSFGAKYPSYIGCQRFVADDTHDALTQAKAWCNANPHKIHNPLYAGKYVFVAKPLSVFNRIVWKGWK